MGSSFIDVTLTKDLHDKIKNWTVVRSTDSDHNYICFNVDEEIASKTKIAWGKTNWKGFREDLSKTSWEAPPQWTASTIEKHHEHITAQISACFKKHAKEVPVMHFKDQNHWQDDTVKPLMRKKKKAFWAFKRNPTDENRQSLKDCRSRLGKKIRKFKRDRYQKALDELSNCSDLSMRLKGLEDKQEIKILSEDGEACSPEESVKNLMDKHCPGSVPVKEEQLPRFFKSKEAILNETKFITTSSVKKAIREFGKHKAAGPDGLKPIILQNLPGETMEAITLLMKACVATGYTPKGWRHANMIFIPKAGKETYDSVSSYRPITLNSFLFKALERVILWWLIREHFEAKKMTKHQYAYRKGMSCETAISRVVDRIESALQRGQQAVGVFLDISGAFDNINHDKALEAMRKREMPELFLNWYGHCLKNRTVTAEVAGASCTRSITRGTAQGGVLSPVIWNIVIEPLLLKMNEFADATGFADDTSALNAGPDPDVSRDMVQRAVNLATAWGIENGLTFNPSKTVVIHFKRKDFKTPRPIKMGGKEIPFSQEVKYLGVKITQNLDWTPHIVEKADKARKLIFASQNYVGKTYGVRPGLMKWIWTSIVTPIMLYACHVWAKKVTMRQKLILNQINRLALLGIAPVHRGTPTAGLEVIYGIPPLHLKARELALSIYGRVTSVLRPCWDGRGQKDQKGHLRLLFEERESLVPETKTDICLKTNWRCKAKLRETEAKVEDLGRTQIYTDGSRMDGKTGGGFLIVQGGREIWSSKFSLENYATVYQAEQTAIELAVRKVYAMGIRGKITLHTDSLSSIQALKAREVKSEQCWSTLQAVNDLAKVANLTLFWIKAHVGQVHNERADELAKAGLDAPRGKHVGISERRVKERFKSRTRFLWMQEWNADKRFRQTKVWFPELNKKNTDKMLRYGRCKLGAMVQWITGFCNLRKHKQRKHNYMDPTCRRCETEEETPIHLTWECPAVMGARVNCLNEWDQQISNPLLHPDQRVVWHPEQIYKFIIESDSEVLLVDHEEYD